MRTQELLRRHLPPPPARILDVGGGPGAHARWLAADSYDVHVVDLILRHLTQAERVGATAELGDARRLKAEDASYDVVLLLGPLYHVPERTDRDRALAEAHRALKPGGLLAAAGINRYASRFEHTAFAHLHKEPLHESVSGILATQIDDGKKAFTKAYFHTGAQLLDEVTTADFANTHLYGIEGPAWSHRYAQHRGPDARNHALQLPVTR